MTIKDVLKKLKVVPAQKAYGTNGRLEIPDIGIGVPLYEAGNGDAQKIVDNINSAAFIRFGDQDIIADHVCQGFSNLINVKPGVTEAYIRYEDGRQKAYTCQCSQLGHIRKSASGNSLLDWTWNRALGNNGASLVIYTCLGNPKGTEQSVTLTYWTENEQ